MGSMTEVITTRPNRSLAVSYDAGIWEIVDRPVASRQCSERCVGRNTPKTYRVEARDHRIP